MGRFDSLEARLRSSPRLRSVGSTTAALLASQVLMAVAGVLAARDLGPTGRGVVTAVLSWQLVLGWFSCVGMHTAASVRLAGAQRSKAAATLATATVHSLVAGGAMAVGAILVIPEALAHLGEDANQLAVCALATIPTVVMVEILLSVNVALGRLALANWARLSNPLALLTGTVALVVADAVTPARIVALSLGSSLLTLVLCAVGLPWRRIALNVTELLGDLKFGVKAHIAILFSVANLRLDLLIMSLFVSSSQVGYYGVANNLMVPVLSFAGAGTLLLTPHIASIANSYQGTGIEERQLASIRREGRLYFIVGAVGGALLAVVAPVAVPLLFGKHFDPVIALVWLLIPGYMARVYVGVVSAGAVGARRPWVGNVAEVAGITMTAALLPILLPRYEAVGAAITSTAAYSTSAVVAFLAIRYLARRSTRNTKAGPEDQRDLRTPRPATEAAGPGG
jgi:O-antigen/teichoic acid export membrane protein